LLQKFCYTPVTIFGKQNFFVTKQLLQIWPDFHFYSARLAVFAALLWQNRYALPVLAHRLFVKAAARIVNAGKRIVNAAGRTIFSAGPIVNAEA
jgi:hypothetical protein